MHPSLDKLYGPWLRLVDDRRGCFPDQLFTEVRETLNNLLLIQAVCHRTRTYSRVPASALPDFIDLVRPALEVMVGVLNRDDEDLFTQALQSFLIIPQFALVKNPKETAAEVRHKIYEFREGPNNTKTLENGKESTRNHLPLMLKSCHPMLKRQLPNLTIKQRRGV